MKNAKEIRNKFADVYRGSQIVRRDSKYENIRKSSQKHIPFKIAPFLRYFKKYIYFCYNPEPFNKTLLVFLKKPTNQ